MARYLTEGAGAFFLVLTVCLTAVQQVPLAPLAVGSVLMIMVYMGAHVSGAHYNPVVSAALARAGKLERKEAGRYAAAQVAGALLAGLAARSLTGMAFVPRPGDGVSMPTALLAEALFAFGLVLVVLNVAADRRTEGNQYFGLAIGFMVMVAGFAAGDISGGVLNPAVAAGTSIASLLTGGSSGGLGNMFLYWVGPGFGALLALRVFRVQREDGPPVETESRRQGTSGAGDGTRRRMNMARLGLVLVLLAGCDRQADEPAPTAALVQARPDATFRTDDEPTLSIGLAQGSDEYLFRGVTAARLSDGGVVAAVDGMHEVRRFGLDGRHLWTSGRQGEGPGEFGNVRLLTGCTSAQSIVAYDYRNGRVTVLDGNGNSIRHVRTLWDGAPVFEIRCAADQRFVVSSMGEDPSDSGPYRSDNSVGVAAIAGSDFAVETLRAGIRGAEGVYVAPDAGLSVIFPRTWGKDLEFVATDEGVWLGTGDSYELELLDWSGATVRRIRWNGPDLTVTDEHVEAHRDQMRQQYAESSAPDWEARFESRWDEEAKYLPSTFPSFSRVLLSDDGNLWVEHFHRPGAERREWVLFAPTGEWLRTVELPAQVVVQDAGADWVLTRTTDELGVERIELYALRDGSTT